MRDHRPDERLLAGQCPQHAAAADGARFAVDPYNGWPGKIGRERFALDDHQVATGGSAAYEQVGLRRMPGELARGHLERADAVAPFDHYATRHQTQHSRRAW